MILELARFLVLHLAISAYGVPGTGTIAIDRQTQAFVRRFDAGAASEREGFDGMRAWRADATGMPRVQGNSGERGEIMQWSTALHAALGACPSHAYLSGATDHVTVDFTRCRTMDGVRVPSRLVFRSQQNGVWVANVTHVNASQNLPSATFAPPARPHDYRLAALTRVPISSAAGSIPQLTVRVNGKPLHFGLDTGGQNLVTSDVAAALGLHVVGSGIVNGGGGGITQIRYAFADSVDVGAARMRHQPFIVLPPHTLPFDLDGLVGYELLARFAARLDLRGQTLELAPQARAFGARAATTPFAYFDRQPQVEGALNDVKGAFSIDTGSNLGAEVQAPAVRTNDLIQSMHATVAAMAADVGGKYLIYIVRAQSIRLGDAVFAEPLVQLMPPASKSQNATTIANVGDGILRRWVLVFDYAHQRLGLLPGGDPAPNVVHDRSGVILGARGDALIAQTVLLGTPASGAGLKDGSVIRAVNGRAVGARDYARVQAILRSAPGTVVRLTLGDRSVRALTLKKYL
jgi:hypothetical protein